MLISSITLSQRSRSWDVSPGDAIKHLKNKIKKYFFGSYEKIECDKNYDWKIITDSFKLSQLEKLKEDFDLKDIKIKCDKIKCGKVYHEKIIIKLVI